MKNIEYGNQTHDENCITLYILDLENEKDIAFYQYLHNFEINIIPMNPQNNFNNEDELDMFANTIIKETSTYNPILNTKEHKIGATTFIISSRFNNSEPSDIASKIARLIQHGNKSIPHDYNYNGGH